MIELILRCAVPFVCAEDAYAAGDKVSHAGKRWVSDISGNVWAPGVYGWTEVT